MDRKNDGRPKARHILDKQYIRDDIGEPKNKSLSSASARRSTAAGKLVSPATTEVIGIFAKRKSYPEPESG